MRALRAFRRQIVRLVAAEGGTSLVEFALVAPVLVFLLVGVVEVGRYTTFAVMAANAARAGAQYGAQNLTTALDKSGMSAAALKDAQNLPSFSAPANYLCSINGAALTTCPSNANGSPQNTVYYVQVQVTGTFKSMLNYPGIPNSIPISGSATMRVTSQ
jgi:Flp pilus assembly protein TadG